MTCSRQSSAFPANFRGRFRKSAALCGGLDFKSMHGPYRVRSMREYQGLMFIHVVSADTNIFTCDVAAIRGSTLRGLHNDLLTIVTAELKPAELQHVCSLPFVSVHTWLQHGCAHVLHMVAGERLQPCVHANWWTSTSESSIKAAAGGCVADSDFSDALHASVLLFLLVSCN